VCVCVRAYMCVCVFVCAYGTERSVTEIWMAIYLFISIICYSFTHLDWR